MPLPAAFEVSVGAGADDAEESSSGGVKLDSTDLDLVVTKKPQTVGLRFVDVAIPRRATIVAAYVQFRVDEADSGPTRLDVSGEAADDATAFIIARRNISSRQRTRAAVPWTLPAWSPVGAAGPAQRTPDLSAVLQEVVDRPGWTSGNALVLILTGSGRRVAEAYEGEPAGTPLLHVEYLRPG